MSDKRRDWLAILLLIESGATFLYGWLYYPISQHHTGDFLAMLSHRDPGTVGYWDGKGVGYGPIFAFYDLALASFHNLTALRLMFAVNLVLLGITLAVLLRLFLPKPRTLRETSVAIFFWVNFYPLIQLVRQDNIEITELLFVALFLAYLAKGRDNAAGVSLGLAISSKLVPVFLLPYLAWRGRWRMIAIAVGTFSVTLVAIAVAKGFSPLSVVDAYRHAATMVWSNEWNNNQAFSGFFCRLFGVSSFANETTLAYPVVVHPHAAVIATQLASVALAVAIVTLFVRRCGVWPGPAASREIELTEIGIAMLSILFVLPHSHTHYFALMVWVYFMFVRQMPKLSARAGWSVLLSFALLGLMLPLRFGDVVVRRFLPCSLIEISKLYSVPMGGALVLLYALFELHRVQVSRSS
jgi:hypothetical protein